MRIRIGETIRRDLVSYEIWWESDDGDDSNMICEVTMRFDPLNTMEIVQAYKTLLAHFSANSDSGTYYAEHVGGPLDFPRTIDAIT